MTERNPSEINSTDLIFIGRITRTQGHRGAVRFLPEFEPATLIEQLRKNELILELRPTVVPAAPAPQTVRRILHIGELWYHQQFVILEFDEIQDMTGAEALRNADVYVQQENLWDLEEQQFYPHEIEGYSVVDAVAGHTLGSVQGVQFGSAHDFLRVSRQGKTFLIPMVKEFVKEIDAEARTIRVTVPPGIDEL